MTDTLAVVLKRYRGSLQRLGEKDVIAMPRTPIGIAVVDDIIGGGIPHGRIMEVYGSESSGKSTLALHATAAFQRAGQTVVYMDAENSFDPMYAAAVGVEVDGLILGQPDSGEQFFDMASDLLRTGEVGLIVIDSVAALTPQAELDAGTGDPLPAAHPRMMSRGMRRLVAASTGRPCALLFVNQIRVSIGVLFGNPEYQPGGKALKFDASIRLDMRAIGGEKGKLDGGGKVKVTVVKNKTAPPKRVAILNLEHGLGFTGGELLSIPRKG